MREGVSSPLGEPAHALLACMSRPDVPPLFPLCEGLGWQMLRSHCSTPLLSRTLISEAKQETMAPALNRPLQAVSELRTWVRDTQKSFLSPKYVWTVGICGKIPNSAHQAARNTNTVILTQLKKNTKSAYECHWPYCMPPLPTVSKPTAAWPSLAVPFLS